MNPYTRRMQEDVCTHQDSDVEPLLLREVLRDPEHTVKRCSQQILLLARLSAAPFYRQIEQRYSVGGQIQV